MAPKAGLSHEIWMETIHRPSSARIGGSLTSPDHA